MNVHHGEGASLLDATAALCTCGRSVGRSQWNFFNSASSHHSWERRYSTALGYHLVATRHIPEGETVVAEEPLLAGKCLDNGDNDPGWARSCLRAFCDAPEATRSIVLAMFAGEAGTAEFDSARADAAREVAMCAELGWRRASSSISDSALERVCLVFQLNGYTFGDSSQIAIFEAGCTMAHSCASNCFYASGKRRGKGSFIARRDIAVGENLTTNYLGPYAAFMSTPARRQALLGSKCFECQCDRCRDAADPLREVPCPRCHPRSHGEAELAAPIAFAQVPVHYAAPLSSEPGARWGCRRCGASFTVEEALPAPASQGKLAGREWERVVEQHVLNLDKRYSSLESAAAAEASAVRDDARNLRSLVALSVGSRHWTTRRLNQMLS